ncbi:hypothetical protein NSK_007785 [Nannochloropsis salina CCMP1776]|uniref:Dynamin-type G domain-containing protein n=1 Tax=Nannochloropsis salina CCMP1776 TaxID=1027361 RepID=A0A4D9CQV4_9STRA|nr:hypothetical protein NSK_007785 [Nannochloropsis salina CCMP1776]|eukprot:TFJ80894.1 hypothetical protein NSK_007785 [Nannochloropsis salina CCMP1776]
MKSDRSKSNAGNGDWRKKQVEEEATAHTHPLDKKKVMYTQDMYTQDVEEIEEDDGFEDLGRRDDEVKRRGNSVDDENLKLADDPEASSSNPPQTRDDIAAFHHASSHSSSTSFLKKRRKQFEIPPHQVPGQAYHATIQKLKALYRGKVLELEEKYLFHRFGFEELTQQQLEAKAQVLLLGQYSTGKTTMIRYLLGREYLGLHVGPEPTTDRYVAIVHGDVDDVISGKVLTENPALPFKETERFAGLGGKFQASRCPAPILESLTLIDTPGVLSGEKQLAREYDFRAVTKWFAMRSDLILLLFDPSKLDVSDELKQVISDLKACSSKAPLVFLQRNDLAFASLLHVEAILETPEVVRVYIGSFWEKPLRYPDLLFEEDEASLLAELEGLPHHMPKQRINNLADRVGVLKFYLHLMVAIRGRLSGIPIQFVQRANQEAILEALPNIVDQVLLNQRKKLAHKDVPPLATIKAHLISSFSSLHDLPCPSPADLTRVDVILDKDIPELIAEVDGAFSLPAPPSLPPSRPPVSKLGALFSSPFRGAEEVREKGKKSSGGLCLKGALVMVVFLVLVIVTVELVWMLWEEGGERWKYAWARVMEEWVGGKRQEL